jgi:hypothetical protein
MSYAQNELRLGQSVTVGAAVGCGRGVGVACDFYVWFYYTGLVRCLRHVYLVWDE